MIGHNELTQRGYHVTIVQNPLTSLADESVQSIATMGQPFSLSWAIIAKQDRAFDAAMLQCLAKRINARIAEVDASHAVFMPQRKVVADVIDQAAEGVN